MEVRFSEALPLEKAIRSGSYPNESPPLIVVPNRTEAPQPVELLVKNDVNAENQQVFDRDTVVELVTKTTELLSTFDRELKYEVKADADVVQIQVIDSRDGRVVRKIPADEVIKFIEHMKDQIDDRVDVWA